jgi:hypothetical protein
VALNAGKRQKANTFRLFDCLLKLIASQFFPTHILCPFSKRETLSTELIWGNKRSILMVSDE